MDIKRDFLTLRDISSKEISRIIKRAIEFKAGKDVNRCPLIGKSIGLLILFRKRDAAQSYINLSFVQVNNDCREIS